MEGKTVIITGANRGIGKYTAMDIARKGARTILACRNMEAAEKTQKEIIEQTKNPNVLIKKLDLSSQKSIRNFAKDITTTEPYLHVLIHNAAIIPEKIEVTEDNVEKAMATNHFGPFLLTHLLINLLKKSAPSRIIVVSSISYLFTTFQLSDINAKSCWIPSFIYFRSKYANICFTEVLAKKLKGTGVTANCLHPGLVDTDIWNSFPSWSHSLVRILRKYFYKNMRGGSETSVYLACSEDVERVSGQFFKDCKVTWLWKGNTAKMEEFWELSKNLSGLRKDDPEI